MHWVEVFERGPDSNHSIAVSPGRFRDLYGAVVSEHCLVPGDLFEIEGWWFIEDGDVCADFLVTWLHPDHGASGIYRCGGCGYDASGGLGPEQLATVVEHTVLGEAEYDFAHDGAYFARDLRIAPVRDTTDAAT